MFCKKGDLSSTQGALLCTVSVFFYFTFLFILGVRTHQRTPPAEPKKIVPGGISLLFACVWKIISALGVSMIIVKKLNSLKHLVRTTVAESHN